MNSTTRTNPPDLEVNEHGFNPKIQARNYGLVLAVLTAGYLLVLNLIYGEVPLGARFAKHLFIIPVVWMAVASYAAKLPEGKVFKNEIGFLGRLAIWAGGGIALLNVVLFAVADFSFEQFMQEGSTFAGVMINSGFLVFETVVFIMIFGFVILQAYKGKGSPED